MLSRTACGLLQRDMEQYKWHITITLILSGHDFQLQIHVSSFLISRFQTLLGLKNPSRVFVQLVSETKTEFSKSEISEIAEMSW